MGVLIPVDTMDFDFNSARSSPSVSAPSTPKHFGEFYCSAPTSPSHLSRFYRDFDEFLITSGGSSGGGGVLFDFAFDVSEVSETTSLSAEELFDGGVIKPLTLKLPPRLQLPSISQLATQKQAGINLKSPRGKIFPASTVDQRWRLLCGFVGERDGSGSVVLFLVNSTPLLLWVVVRRRSWDGRWAVVVEWVVVWCECDGGRMSSGSVHPQRQSVVAMRLLDDGSIGD